MQSRWIRRWVKIFPTSRPLRLARQTVEWTNYLIHPYIYLDLAHPTING